MSSNYLINEVQETEWDRGGRVWIRRDLKEMSISGYVGNLFGSWFKQTIKKHLLVEKFNTTFYDRAYLLDVYAKIFSYFSHFIGEMIWHLVFCSKLYRVG